MLRRWEKLEAELCQPETALAWSNNLLLVDDLELIKLSGDKEGWELIALAAMTCHLLRIWSGHRGLWHVSHALRYRIQSTYTNENVGGKPPAQSVGLILTSWTCPRGKNK